MLNFVSSLYRVASKPLLGEKLKEIFPHSVGRQTIVFRQLIISYTEVLYFHEIPFADYEYFSELSESYLKSPHLGLYLEMYSLLFLLEVFVQSER